MTSFFTLRLLDSSSVVDYDGYWGREGEEEGEYETDDTSEMKRWELMGKTNTITRKTSCDQYVKIDGPEHSFFLAYRYQYQ